MLLAAVAAGAAAADPATVSRGAYLAAGAGCDQCHTDAEHGGQPYAGGRQFATEFGTVSTPNITPDRETGIGGWSPADFGRAMRWGIAPDDTHYLPIFPFPYFGRLGDADLADLKAFLDSLPPVRRSDRPTSRALALAERARAAIGVAVSQATPWRPDSGRDAVWNRGSYLVATIGRCADCHTPRTLLGAVDEERFLAGSGATAGRRKAPNITPDPHHGIGDWSEDDIVALLTLGQTPDVDFVGGAMAEVVKNTSRLSEADRRAIAAFLKTVPAK